MKEKILLSWSGGKDSCTALYEVQRSQIYEIILITTVTEGYDRISMHGVRRILLERQAESLGLGLTKIYIPQNATNEDYELRMKEAIAKNSSAREIENIAAQNGMVTLRQRCLEKINEGITTLEEFQKCKF